MNPESPKFESKTIKTFSIPDGAKMLVFEQTFYNEEPAATAKENIPEVEIPVVPSITSPEVVKKLPEYTESQLFWQKIFDNGDQPLYDTKKGPIKFDAVKEVFNNFNSKSVGEHIMAIDKDFRGGRDAGSMKERAQRVGVLMGVLGAFTAFDHVTSMWFDDDSFAFKRYPRKTGDLRRDAKVEAFLKVAEVINDKYASALGNMLVENLTGKRGFIHEVADKGADTITVAFKDSMDDLVNGPNLESAQRILFQVPIVGALLEQGFTRLSMLQETSSIHTATGKAFYMAMGVYLATRRDVKSVIAQKKQVSSE